MALPVGEDLKTYLRIEHDAEDALCAELVEAATGYAESLIGRPILAKDRTYTNLPIWYDALRQATIYLPEYPVALSTEDAIEITDGDGEVVDSADYVVSEAGKITTVLGKTLAISPYTVTAKVGLSLASDYAARIEPMLKVLIIGIAAVWYRQRNPNVVSDSGVTNSVTFASNEYTDGLPPHLYGIVRKLRPVRIA